LRTFSSQFLGELAIGCLFSAFIRPQKCDWSGTNNRKTKTDTCLCVQGRSSGRDIWIFSEF
jgi:hypothetical protein